MTRAASTCPLCTIYLVEANSSDSSDLQTAEAEAVTLGAHIVSNSWGCLGAGCLFSSYSYGGGWGSPNGIKAL